MVKKINFSEIKNFLRLLKNINSEPNHLFDFKSKYGVSNLFLFRNDGFKTYFSGENTLAILSKSNIDVEHQLLLFDCMGKQIDTLKILSNKYYETIEFKNKTQKYGGFIHQLKYEDKYKFPDIFNMNKIKLYHRGYTSFTYKQSNFQNFVHGKLGSIYKNKIGILNSR